MNSHADVASILAAAKPANLVALEAQFDEAQEKLRAVFRDLSVEQEAASCEYSSPFKIKTDATLAAAAEKVATLTATKNALEKTSAEIRRQIEAARPASIAAIRKALDPVRQQAANDISLAAKTLYDALARFNATSEALDRNGDRAPLMPATIPVLDMIVNQVVKV